MTKACDEVMKEIMKQIDTQQIIPGRRLYESDIAQQLGMSRTPVRQALDQMVADGIFERISDKRGVVFPPLTRDDWASVVIYREVLEVAIARLVAENITEAGLAELEQSYNKMLLFHEEKREEEEGEETYLFINSSFHITLASLCGNAYLLQSLKRIFWRSRLYDFYLGSFRRHDKKMNKLVYDYEMLRLSNEGHRQIIDAIREKNADLAAEMTQRHLRDSVITDGNMFRF